MLMIPQAKTQQRRIKVALPKNAPPLPPLVISDVVDVFFDGPSGQLTVRLDVAAGYALVEPPDVDPAQWTAVFGGTLYQGNDLSFEGENAITITFSDQGGSAEADHLNYVAGPSEIVDTQGRMLGVVDAYPL